MTVGAGKQVPVAPHALVSRKPQTLPLAQSASLVHAVPPSVGAGHEPTTHEHLPRRDGLACDGQFTPARTCGDRGRRAATARSGVGRGRAHRAHVAPIGVGLRESPRTCNRADCKSVPADTRRSSQSPGRARRSGTSDTRSRRWPCPPSRRGRGGTASRSPRRRPTGRRGSPSRSGRSTALRRRWR